jgi:hypothetical protein
MSASPPPSSPLLAFATPLRKTPPPATTADHAHARVGRVHGRSARRARGRRA